MIRIDTEALFPLLEVAAPAEGGRGHCRIVASERRLARRLGPSLLDPVGGSSRLVVPFAGLRPIRRRGDVADRNGNDPVGIPARERIVGQVLAESGHRVLIALVVVGTDVEVARRGIHAEAFELADDRLVLWPAAGE